MWLIAELTLLLVASVAFAQPVATRVRYFPAPGAEAAMVGGAWEGSNTSPTAGFEMLATIAGAPAAGQWSEIELQNRKVYRWLRYRGAPGSHGKVGEVEFYAGTRKISGPGVTFGTSYTAGPHTAQHAVDGNPKTWFESYEPDGAFIAIDLKESATARTPALDPPPGIFAEPVRVVLTSATPGAVIRYTLDGVPREHIYKGPLEFKKTTTIYAVSLLEGRAASPPVWGTYLVGHSAKPGFSTFHLGNSLTRTTENFGKYARTAGYRHDYQLFVMPGAPTIKLWNVGRVDEKDRWQKTWDPVARIDHLTLQPRDFDIAEEADYSSRFIALAHARSPEVQPWLYTEWTEAARLRPTDKGMATWEESMAGMLQYVEDVQRKILETHREGKCPRVLPSAIAMGWIHNMIENGSIPGLDRGSFYPVLFRDQVHPGPNGAYLVDLTWFSAFYRESPEKRVLPVATDWTPEQAAILQNLAWDVIRNYPDCGLYEEGKTPVAAPRFSARDGRVTISSSTPGAWFRYTLDSTTPTRTRGYVYCGVVTLRPGTVLKAIAFKSGMADSGVSVKEP